MTLAVEYARLESEITALRALIASNDRRYEERYSAEREAQHKAVEINEKRLYAMNEFRAAMSDQANKYITRMESDSARGVLAEKLEQQIGALHTRIEADIRPINNRLGEMSRPNWMFLIAMVSVTFSLIAGGWLVLGLKIDAAMSPVAQMADQSRINLASNNTQLGTITQDVRASTTSDSASRADRVQLNDRLGKLETVVGSGQADRRAAQAAQGAALIEIETQFRGLSHYTNEMKDTNNRLFGLLWQRVYKELLPATDFKPEYFRHLPN